MGILLIYITPYAQSLIPEKKEVLVSGLKYYHRESVGGFTLIAASFILSCRFSE